MGTQAEHLYRVAIHEAGHAVCRLVRGHTVDFVTIEPDEEGGSPHPARGRWRRTPSPADYAVGSGGCTRGVLDRMARANVNAAGDEEAGHAAVCVAGEVAERIAFGAPEEGELLGDRTALMALFLRHDGDGAAWAYFRREALTLAEQILRDNWPGVQAVALEALKTLTGEAAAAEVIRAA